LISPVAHVADRDNNRVLYYASTSTIPSRVYGQLDSFFQGLFNAGNPTIANTFDIPLSLALDATGGLYIADAGNNLVLYYAEGSTTARGKAAASSQVCATTAALWAPAALIRRGDSQWTPVEACTWLTVGIIACCTSRELPRVTAQALVWFGPRLWAEHGRCS
jgi:hypothetical protein